jgi:hypothetical protein
VFLCFVSNGAGGWNTSQVSVATDCTGFVAQSANSYSDLALLFKTYFEFDQVLAGEIMGWYLLAFVMGHGLGRMMRVWQKAM